MICFKFLVDKEHREDVDDVEWERAVYTTTYDGSVNYDGCFPEEGAEVGEAKGYAEGLRNSVTFCAEEGCTKQNQNPISQNKREGEAEVAEVKLGKDGDEEGEDAIFFEEV